MGVCAPPPRCAKMWVQQGTGWKTTAIAKIVTCGSACTSGLSLRSMSFCPPLPLPSPASVSDDPTMWDQKYLQHETRVSSGVKGTRFWNVLSVFSLELFLHR